MRYVTLIAATDEYDNKPGLIVKGTKLYDGMMADRDGTLVAHDLIEHQNGSAAIGPVWDELEAMGGLWHARGRWGDIRGSVHSPQVNCAGDITRMASDWDGSDMPSGHNIGIRPSLWDDDFAGIIAIARHDIPREHDYLAPEMVERYLDLAMRRMRSGFRKANKRFGDMFASNNQFNAIADAVARCARHVDYEGQEFTLGYGGGDACCYERYSTEDY